MEQEFYFTPSERKYLRKFNDIFEELKKQGYSPRAALNRTKELMNYGQT